MSAPEGTAPVAPAQAAPAGDGGGDALDKGLNTIAGKLGLGQQSHSNVEKVRSLPLGEDRDVASDGIRGLFKKSTGKDVPIADKEYK
ncbi:hypothetical protein RQP46_006151 [Phenoliferia psychrophenolica]